MTALPVKPYEVSPSEIIAWFAASTARLGSMRTKRLRKKRAKDEARFVSFASAGLR